MLQYSEIFTVQQTIDGKRFTLMGARNDATAAKLAAQRIAKEGHVTYTIKKDFETAWLVAICTPLTENKIVALTEAELIERLKAGDVIEYVDMDKSVCTIWISVLKVFE